MARFCASIDIKFEEGVTFVFGPGSASPIKMVSNTTSFGMMQHRRSLQPCGWCRTSLPRSATLTRSWGCIWLRGVPWGPSGVLLWHVMLQVIFLSSKSTLIRLRSIELGLDVPKASSSVDLTKGENNPACDQINAASTEKPGPHHDNDLL